VFLSKVLPETGTIRTQDHPVTETDNIPRTPKALTAAVIIMGVLIIVGTVTLVGLIIHRIGHHSNAQSALPAHVPLQDAVTTQTELPPGTTLTGMTRVQDDLLALQVNENGEQKILLWQVSTRRLLPGLTIPAAKH